MSSEQTWEEIEGVYLAQKSAALSHAVTSVCIDVAMLAEARMCESIPGSEEHALALADLIRARRGVFELVAHYIDAKRALARAIDGSQSTDREAA